MAIGSDINIFNFESVVVFLAIVFGLGQDKRT